MTTQRWSMARPTMAGVAITLAFVTACSGPRSGASATSDVSGCAAVLPLARTIVHDQGTLTLIRHINQADADALAHQFGVTPTTTPVAHTKPGRSQPLARTGAPKACLVVYHGSYPPGTISGASPPAVAGHYTLIVLSVRHPAIERVLVTDTLPAGLNHHRFIPFA